MAPQLYGEKNEERIFTIKNGKQNMVVKNKYRNPLNKNLEQRGRIMLPVFFIFLLCFLSGCTQAEGKKNTEPEIAKKEYLPEKNEVETMVLEETPFKKELLSNGTLVANQKSVLKFKVSGSLDNLMVKNGDFVKKGQALAAINDFRYRQTLSSSEISYERALLEFKDMLVGRGYDLENKKDIPENIYEMASIRSGYSEAKNQMEIANFDVNATTLRAPFSGKVANIQFNEHEYVNAGTEFITLIDDAVFNVVFHLIESEINQIGLGEDVEISAFSSGENYEGKIISINPVVEENGMVQVKARVKNDGKLMEGMNVEVLIQKDVPKQLVVPKSAVVLRQNQEVLFKYQDGNAFWTYVQTMHENSSSYAVIADPEKSSASLTPGDTVIVSGNLNLAHDSEVVIKPDTDPNQYQ